MICTHIERSKVVLSKFADFLDHGFNAGPLAGIEDNHSSLPQIVHFIFQRDAGDYLWPSVTIISITPDGAAHITVKPGAVSSKCQQVGNWEGIFFVNFESIIVEHRCAPLLSVRPLVTRRL